MTCKGICTRYKAQKPVGTGRYASGQKRCQICEIFINGKVFGVLVADTDSELNHETSNTKRSYAQESKLIN